MIIGSNVDHIKNVLIISQKIFPVLFSLVVNAEVFSFPFQVFSRRLCHSQYPIENIIFNTQNTEIKSRRLGNPIKQLHFQNVY